MDPFSVALGVLQITGVAIKVSLFLQNKIKVFRNYSKEVNRIFKGIKLQQNIFVHEIHLLLRLAKQGEHDIERMLQDADDAQWRSQDLQSGLDSAFLGSLDTVQDIMEEFRSTLQDLRVELACFDEIERMGSKVNDIWIEYSQGTFTRFEHFDVHVSGSNYQKQNERLKDTVLRVRKKVKITWDKVKLEDHMKSLRDHNDDLRRLREQATEIKEPVHRSTACLRPIHQLSQEYGSIGKVRRASIAFHQALAAAWLKEISNMHPGGIRHNVKLKVDAQVRDEVKMDIVIACYGHSRPQATSIQAGLLNLHVESRVLDFMESELNTPPNSGDDGRRKKRRVRFNFDDNQEEPRIAPTVMETQKTRISDLRAAQNICTALRGTSADPCGTKCLGYLDSCCNETFRHSFFGIETTRPISESICVSTEDILSRPVESSVTFVDQLILARSFALAVLKFHSTPWLREYVSIRELAFFRFGDGDLSSCIRTAHLGSNFVHPSLHEDFPIPTEDMDDSDAIEDAKLAHGVRNLTLWGLGTVMLQIGMWSTLECPDDVVAVRRLAQKVSILGKRYRDLTKQCLDCDFAFGDDLSKPRLHQAVYEHLVCGLTEMIKTLEIEDD